MLFSLYLLCYPYSLLQQLFAAAELSSPLCSVFESPARLSTMSATLRKRCLEPEALPDFTDLRESKRFNGICEETDLFLHLPLIEKTPAENEEVNEECASSEDFVTGVMRSLEEEISATCSTFYAPISGDNNSSAYDICSVHEGQTLISDSDIDLCYLLEASDDELGIPSSPILDSKNEFCQPPKETFTAEGLSATPDLKCQGENWDFVDEFQNYQHFALLENAWDANHVQDYTNKDFSGQEMLFEGDFPAAWTLETAGYM